MKRKILALILSTFMVTGSGCSAVQKVVDAFPTVIQYVQDANMVLDAIDRAVVPLLALKGDPEFNHKYAGAMDAVRRTLQVALRSVEGGKNLSEEEVDAAFVDFRAAYVQLRVLLEQSGLMNSAGTFAAVPGKLNLTVPEPLAMRAGTGT